MFQTLINNPKQTFASFVFLSFIISLILLGVSYTKVKNAIKEEKLVPTTWKNIETTSYVWIALCAFVFMVYACSNDSFSCFFIFTAFN